MAGPCTHRSPRQNSRTAGEDKLSGVFPTEGSGIPTPTPVVSSTPIPAQATALAVVPSSYNKLFKQFMKAYLEAQVPAQIAPNRILFAALFLQGSVTQQWLQHKQCRNGVVPITWLEFKEFL